VCWNQDSVPAKYRFLDPGKDFEKPRSGEEFDLVIATDCASYERLGTVTDFINSGSSSSTLIITRAIPVTAM